MWDIIKTSSTRIKTGLAMLIVVLIVAIVDSYLVTWAVLGMLMMVGLKEMNLLSRIEDNRLYIVAGVIWIVAYFYPHPQDLAFVSFVLFASILAYKQEFDKRLFIPLLYPLVPFLFILALYFDYGMLVLFWLLLIVAGTDVGAYFVGRKFGKTKFAPSSPNKTIEGVIGGVVVGTLLSLLMLFLDLSIWKVLLISLITSIASVYGDLFESYLKREANVKDSGDLFPGHGGVLDRVDGYLFASIIMYVLIGLIL
ncbi:MAG: phosphatidate cytidylyltransferase [Arcobacter butzleri]|jgi:phosphatidate cytidylyltransferase|nr:phosphatidate cytidylyltransferase [Arcobacteraceae bacterium]MDY0365885.1 phosphatidate cytidylyltransferase [Arcobacteraceae bacterium]NLO17139.1 phosphatidate cytidylyltransferase [Aliarcobacter butzleri]